MRADDADSAAGIGADCGQDWQLVNELRRSRAADGRGAHAVFWPRDLNRADQLGVLLLHVEDGEVRAESGEHVEQ